MPFLNAKRLGGNMELCSSHQSSRVLRINSKDLHSAEERAIGRNALLELGYSLNISADTVGGKTNNELVRNTSSEANILI
ncbi:hypothetical protein QTP88_000456 [Uroleucon formosanum]